MLRYAGQLGQYRLERSGDEARADELPPGDWSITASGPGIAAAWHAFEVRAGEPTVLELVR